MSEEWPNAWYRDEPGQQARPSPTPLPDAEGSPYEPTQAVPCGTGWPAQPPTRSWPGPHSAHGEPPGMRPGQHGYEFKTKAPVSMCVYICRHLHGMTPY